MAHIGSVLLVHGGLWEDDAGADSFWRRTGVADGLEQRGFTVLAPDRPRRAATWTAEAAHLAVAVGATEGGGRPDDPVRDSNGAGRRGLTVVGGSFGCAAAVRLALDFPWVAARLVLAWPASLGDQFTTIRLRAGLSRLGARGAVLDALLGTGALPSAADSELAALGIPVGIIPAVPPGPVHPRSAVDALLRLLPSATELAGCPEAPRPEFPPHLEDFLTAVAAFAGG
jgi:pimeloyl-ACP methyl ester carboxylesterase